jgi:hypothetical protein
VGGGAVRTPSSQIDAVYPQVESLNLGDFWAIVPVAF